MSNIIQNTYELFTDIDGTPLEDGYIFIGVAGLDPIANPLQAYWDEALTVPASAIRTKGGYPVHSTFPGRLYIATNYSVLVQNKRGLAVYASVDSKAMTLFPDGIEFSDGRIANNELPSVSLASGSWNIAELEAVAGGRANTTFKLIDAGGTTTVEAEITMSTSAKTHANTVIHIIGKSGVPLITTVKMGKSDSVDASGALITIELSSASIIIAELIGNTGSGSGFALITPDQLTDLPDGVTAATFLEAGEELDFVSQQFNGVKCRKVSNDILYVSVPWDQIPKQATGVTLGFPGGAFVFSDGNGASASLISSDTYVTSNLVMLGEQVTFYITTSGASAGKWTSLLTGSAIGMFPTSGTGSFLLT